MSKSQKSQKLQKSQKIDKQLFDSNSESDSDNEIEIHTKNVTEVPISNNVIKPKTKRNISEEQKQILRDRLQIAREKKSKQKDELKAIQEEFLKSKAIELNQKVLNNAKKIKKQQEKEYLKQFMLKETQKSIKTKKNPVVVFDENSSEDESDESESEPEPIIKKKTKVIKKNTTPVEKKPIIKKYNDPPTEQPYYNYPKFVIH
jgi:hypothetical protein